MRSTRTITVYYAVLGVIVAAVAAFVFAAGAKEHPTTPVAGGYDLAAADACLGQKFDVKQSGQFVSIDGDGKVGGKLRLRDGRLSGDVSCGNGSKAKLLATPGKGRLSGTVGGRRFVADQKRDAKAPGAAPRIPASAKGDYKVLPRSPCLGGLFTLEGSSDKLRLVSKDTELGTLRYQNGTLEGQIRCPDGERTLTGDALDRQITITMTPAGSPAGTGERVAAQRQREFGHTLGAFFIAIAIVMLFARLTGEGAVRIGQPRVMGEVVAGILLGPTLLGRIAPDIQTAIFPVDVIPYIGVAANLGLIFYMFLVGLELDFGQLRGRIMQTAAISNTGVALPMALGLLVALPVYKLVAPDTKFAAFALFMGVAMSITAFPVLARILAERRMLKRPIGALALAAAAIDDVSAWFLIALASAVATAGSSSDVLRTIAFAIAFCAGMAYLARPLLARVSVAYDEAGRVPGAWVTAIFAGVLVSAYTTETIGIALIFGAFIMGAIMPRHAGLTEDVTHRLEDFVVLLLLPLFFAYTGLRTDVGLLDRPELLLLTLGLFAIAVVAKFGGCLLAARITGLKWRESAVIGVLMNTRGLTELIVLNLALEKGVISEALFAMLVIMALATTFMAGPLLRLLDPDNSFGAPVEEELEEARKASLVDSPVPIPERSIMVAPQSDAAVPQLLALAEPLATSEPPRELILVRLVEPPRSAAVRGGLQTENREVAEAQSRLVSIRLGLLARRVAARAIAFSSVDPGADLARLAENQDVDLLMLDGRRPLVGEGVPKGAVGSVLRRAPCDVAVLVAREGQVVVPSAEEAVIVPFSGAEHDWAALELGAWIASANGAPLRLLGAGGEDGGASRLLANASLILQQFSGITATPVVAEPGAGGLIEAAADAGLLVIGLSDRWREEGLGATRSEIARAAPAPVLFVRRGIRPGALAPRDNVTRFTWSMAGNRSPLAPPSQPSPS